MAKEVSMVSRRQFIKLSSIFAALPLVSLVKLISPASAAVMVKVPTDDPAAIALKYVEVASAAVRTDEMGVPGSEQTFGNCRFYKDSEDTGVGRVHVVPEQAGSESRLVYGLDSGGITLWKSKVRCRKSGR